MSENGKENLAQWVIKASEMYLSLIYDRMHKELSTCPVIQCDETPVNVSKDGRPAGSKSYMWVYRTSERMSRPPIVLYDYEKTRHSDRPYEFLKEFNGYLICDRFSGYETLGHKKPGVKIVNCLAHARRPFADIEKSLKGYENESGSISKEALSRIRKIYEVEGNLTDCSADEQYARRHQEIEPLIEAYFAWVKTSSTKLHLCRGCRLAQGVSCVFRFSSQTRKSSCAVSGDRRGSQHSGDYKVPVLADDERQQAGLLCLCEL